MLANMKKVSFILVVLLCVFLTGCNNEFAKEDYNSDAAIANTSDHYAKESSVFNQYGEKYVLMVSKFDGRETLWSDTFRTDRDMDIEFSLRLSNGQAKVVHVDEDGNVTTILECMPETSTDGSVTETVSMKQGENRLKIVGYDCEDMELTMVLSE